MNHTSQSNKSDQARRLKDGARNGWLSAKANVVPGMVIVSIAALLVAAYYLFPDVNTSLLGLQLIRRQWGVWFSMAAGAVGAGIIPGVYLLLTGKTRRGWRAGTDLLYTCVVWAVSALVIDRFYVLQDWWWGSAVTPQIVLAKMLADQFVFTPLLGLQIPAFGLRLRDMHYDLFALGRTLRTDWLMKVTVPMLVACWFTWIPGTLVIHALPLSLQIPMMVLIQCFFSLEMAYASGRM
jgi:hypothetical protein